MKYALSHLLICFVMFLQVQPLAHAGQELTWDDCLREAAQHHPDIKAAAQDIKIQKASKQITQSKALPQITAEASKAWASSGGNRGGDGVSGMGGLDQNSYALAGDQLLFDGFKTVHDIKSASQTVKATEFAARLTAATVRFNLRTAFVSLLKAQTAVGLADQILKRRKENLALIRLRYEAGREHQGSLLTSEASVSQAAYELVKAKREILLSQQQLLQEMGRPVSDDIEVKGSLSLPKNSRQSPFFETLVQAHPQLAQLKAEKQSTEQGLKSAKADFVPDLSVTSSVGRGSNQWPPDETEWTVGLGLSVPIFEGGTQIATLKKAKAQVLRSQAQEQSTRAALMSALKLAWTNWQNAIDAYGVQQQFLTAAETRARIANAQYNIGMVTFNEWVIIEDNLVNVQKACLEAQANVLLAEAGWVKAKGVGLQ